MKAQRTNIPVVFNLRRLGFGLLLAAQLAAASDWVPVGPRGDLGTGRARANGRIASIQILPGGDSGNVIYVGASSGGIWRSFGASRAWTDLGRNLPNPSVGAFAVNSQNLSDIVVGTGDWRYPGGGMFHTSDGGAHWAKPYLTNAPGAYYRMAYSINSLDVLLAASNLGLLRSEHGPDGPWYVVLPGVVSDFVLHPSDPNLAFACVAASGAAGGGVYKSTDGGQTWTLKIASHIAPAGTLERGSIAICRGSPNVLVVVWEATSCASGNCDGGNIVAVQRSTDGGETWPDDITGALAGAGNGQASSDLCVAIAPDNANEIYVGATGLWPTFDGGVTWNSAGLGFEIEGHEDNHQLYFSPTDNNTLWICNDGGVYAWQRGSRSSTSFNGDNFSGLQVSQIYNIDAIGNLRFAAMQDDGLNGSADGGVTWKQFQPADGSDIAITSPDSSNPSFWSTSGSGGSLEHLWSGDFNNSQTEVLQTNWGLVCFERFSDRVFVPLLDTSSTPPRTYLVSYPSHGPYITNLEQTLTGWFPGIANNYLDGQTLYLWLNNFSSIPGPNKYNLATLRRSGQSWNLTYTLIGAPGQTNPVNRVVASRQWGGEAWATLAAAPGQPQVFHSTDYGATWTDITGDLTNRFLSQSTLLFEGFEGSFPGGWTVGDDGNDFTPAFWSDVNSIFGGEGTHSGGWKGYCAGSLYPFNSSEPSPIYESSMRGYMRRTINLVGYSGAELRFWYKIPSIGSSASLNVLMDNSGFPLWSGFTVVSNWTEQVVNLNSFVGGTHVLRFEFDSGLAFAAEGCYLDDIEVVGFSQPLGGILTLAASPINNNELYVGTTYGGVFRTLDRGRHWAPFQDGLPLVQVFDSLYVVDGTHSGTDKLSIGTFGRGMYDRALDRPGPVYVNQLNFFGPWNGTIEFPYPTLDAGTNATPAGGYLLLNGSSPYFGSRTLSKPMTISAYQFPAQLGAKGP